MPCPRNWLIVILFVGLIAGYAYLSFGPLLPGGFLAGVRHPLSQQMFWLTLSALFTFNIYGMLFQREEIAIDDQTLRRRIVHPLWSGRGWGWTFALSRISHLRAVPNPSMNIGLGTRLADLFSTRRRDEGAIIFVYEGKLHRIGMGIDQEEAAELIERIKAFAPDLRMGRA